MRFYVWGAQIKFTDFTLPSEGDGDDCEQADTLQVSES